MYMDNLALIWKYLTIRTLSLGSDCQVFSYYLHFQWFLWYFYKVIPQGFSVVVLFVCLYCGSRTNYRQVPIIANMHITRERTRIFSPFFTDDNNKWWQSRQQYPTCVSWLIQKKSDKTPLETIPLYINIAGSDVNEAEMPIAIINRKIIADWCSNDCKILVTPSFFVVRPFLLISLLI
jgi:hypothetical protein